MDRSARHIDRFSLPAVLDHLQQSESSGRIFHSATHLDPFPCRVVELSGLAWPRSIEGIGSAAYAIARFQVGKKNLAFWILSIRMFPPIATILPLFVIFRFAGLVDSYAGLILSYSVFNLPFAIWMLKGFIEDLPREIEEAAKVDGASRFQIFRNIVLPLVAPGLVVVALFTFIFAWNDFAYAVIFSGSNVTPLPVVIAQFAGGHEILWGQISAAAIIAIVPALLLGTFLQKYLTRGLTMGAIK